MTKLSADWPTGVWDDEPDRDEWIDEATGLPCIARRAPYGSWCGYIGVDADHPWFGVAYHQVAPGWANSPESLVDVHGGLTYSDVCRPEIEHLPHDRWWFGFDCSHYMDVAPGLLPYLDNALRLRSSPSSSPSHPEPTQRLSHHGTTSENRR